jgi:hypothetical protein
MADVADLVADACSEGATFRSTVSVWAAMSLVAASGVPTPQPGAVGVVRKHGGYAITCNRYGKSEL